MDPTRPLRNPGAEQYFLEAAGNIWSYVGDLTFEKFKNDWMRVDAVARNFEVIGEAVRNLGDDLKTIGPGNRLEIRCRVPRHPDSWIFRH